MKESNIRNILSLMLHNAELMKHCGYDPYDGLNSKLLKTTPFYSVPTFRLAWIQFFKRSLINFRPLALIPKSFNPKGGSLFLRANIKLFQLTGELKYKEEAQTIYSKLINSKLSRASGTAWGYNFSWQAKAFFVPVGTPNIVTSVYVGHALLDYFEKLKLAEARELGFKVKDFILSEMIMWEKEDKLCFSYIPGEKAEVHNANLLAGAYLSRIYSMTNEDRLKNLVMKSVKFSISHMHENGYWPYGTMPHHRWMDNFHTGFNLEALLDIRKHLNTFEFDTIIKKVFQYYLFNFFLKDGTPKYYHDKIYPIDIHNIAEAIILFSKIIEEDTSLFDETEKTGLRKFIDVILDYAMQNFWDKRGYFYYQKTRFFTNKIPYMRWSQAWMFYALSCYFKIHPDSSLLDKSQCAHRPQCNTSV